MGCVEIVIFGEIDTGKSALINGLVGQTVAEVDVRGGWTKEVWTAAWNAGGYVVPGFEKSQVVLLDTPVILKRSGRGLARDHCPRGRGAGRPDSVRDRLGPESHRYVLLVQLAASHKPILLVLNKIDNYTLEQRR